MKIFSMLTEILKTFKAFKIENQKFKWKMGYFSSWNQWLLFNKSEANRASSEWGTKLFSI